MVVYHLYHALKVDGGMLVTIMTNRGGMVSLVSASGFMDLKLSAWFL